MTNGRRIWGDGGGRQSGNAFVLFGGDVGEESTCGGNHRRPRWHQNGKARAQKNSTFSPTNGVEVVALDGEDLKAARYRENAARRGVGRTR
jgi:hypothetical protein